MSQRRRFNTHGLDDAFVEAVATGRDGLRDLVLRAIESNLTSHPKQHLLLRAPRGAGKSFLMRMVQIAIRRQAEAEGWPVVAVLLPEEQRNIRRPHLFLAEIRRILEGRPAGEVRVRWAEEAGAWDRELALLDEAIGERLLVVMVENFDHLAGTVFEAEHAQGVLRHALAREEGHLMLIATSTGRVAPDYDDPLFRNFRELTLKPWTEAQCLEYFEHLRARENLPGLTPEERRRAQAIALFGGGSPRIATVLYEVLDQPDAMTIAQALDRVVDELADYYRNRLDGLSPRAADILDTLLRMGEPQSQTAVAGALEEQQSGVAELFSELLADQILVGTAARHSRETLYQLSDRLMVHFYRTRYFDPEARQSRLEAIAELLAIFLTEEEKAAHAAKFRAEGRAAEAALMERVMRPAQDSPGHGGGRWHENTFHGKQRALQWAMAAGETLPMLALRRAEIAALAEGLDQQRLLDWWRRQWPGIEAGGDPRLQSLALRQIGFCQIELGQHAAAIETLRDALTRATQAGDTREQAIALCQIGWSQGQLGQHAAAIATLRDALTRATQAGDTREQAIALRHIGFCQGELGQHAAAIETLRDALTRATQAGDTREQATALRYIGWSQGELGQHAAAIETLRDALTRATQAGDTREQAVALRLIGFSQGALGQHAAAIETLRDALTRATQAGDAPEQAVALRHIGFSQGALGQHAAAIETLRDALTRATQAGDTREQAEALRLIGFSQGALGQHAAAIETLRDALTRATQAGDAPEQAVALRYIGFSQGALGQHAAAIETLRDALTRATQAGDTPEQAMALRQIGWSQGALGQHAAAIETLRDALTRATQAGDAPEQAEALRLIGFSQGALGQHAAAIETLTEAARRAKGLGWESSSAYSLALGWRDAAGTDSTIPGIAASLHAMLALGETALPALALDGDEAAVLALREGSLADIWPALHQDMSGGRSPAIGPRLAREIARIATARGRAPAYAAADIVLRLCLPPAAQGPAAARIAATLGGFLGGLVQQLENPALLRDITENLEHLAGHAQATQAAMLRARALELENPNDPAALERVDPDIVAALRRRRGITAPEELYPQPGPPPRRRKRRAKKRGE